MDILYPGCFHIASLKSPSINSFTPPKSFFFIYLKFAKLKCEDILNLVFMVKPYFLSTDKKEGKSTKLNI